MGEMNEKLIDEMEFEDDLKREKDQLMNKIITYQE